MKSNVTRADYDCCALCFQQHTLNAKENNFMGHLKCMDGKTWSRTGTFMTYHYCTIIATKLLVVIFMYTVNLINAVKL